MAGVLVLAGSLTGCPTEPEAPPASTTTTTTTTTTPPCVAAYIKAGTPGSLPATGWWSSDTRSQGAVYVDSTYGAPAGFGCNAVILETRDNTQINGIYQDKAQLFNYSEAGTPLGTVTELSYWAYRSSASSAVNTAINVAMNVQVAGSTVPGNFATLVYEPYNQSGGNAGIVPDTWQQWDTLATSPGDGEWWTTKIGSGPGSQGDPQPWSFFVDLYTDGQVVGYGYNLGSNNPNTITAADGVTFNSTTTDF